MLTANDSFYDMSVSFSHEHKNPQSSISCSSVPTLPIFKPSTYLTLILQHSATCRRHINIGNCYYPRAVRSRCVPV